MARPPKPWYRKARKCWCVSLLRFVECAVPGSPRRARVTDPARIHALCQGLRPGTRP
jgi:hypothetical protein